MSHWIPLFYLDVVVHPYRGFHYNYVIMGTVVSQITSVSIVYLTVSTGTDQRKHQRSASLAFVRGIHRGPVNSPHKWPVTRKMFPFDDVIMLTLVSFWISEYPVSPAGKRSDCLVHWCKMDIFYVFFALSHRYIGLQSCQDREWKRKMYIYCVETWSIDCHLSVQSNIVAVIYILKWDS